MILLIDNYDSFVYNLARYVRELGQTPLVRRHDTISCEDISALAPTHIIISPGPCTPEEAGVSTEVVRQLGRETPILGVCLGHQCIGAAYGAAIVRARRPMHGKTSQITHVPSDIFRGIPSPFLATRYHSLVIDPSTVPGELEVIATAEDGEIMGVRHRHYPVVGLQFHPESVLTEHGYRLIANFLGLTASMPLPAEADAVPMRVSDVDREVGLSPRG
jgi:anthranilate synthase/aminodeoxychorismate synthase-like glutamine amidotransferase